jgi:hypothetical protein
MRPLPNVPMITVVCALALAIPAAAQTRVERVWLDLSVGSAMAAEDAFAMTASVARFEQQADFGAHYHLPRRASFAIGGGVMVGPRIGIGVCVGGVMHEARADLTARVPHPYFVDAFASASGQTDIPMQRIERSVAAHAMLVAMQTKHVRLRAFGGPSYFHVQQDSVTGLTYNQFYFVRSPTNVVELTDYEFERRDGSGWGFQTGADASVFFTRVLGVGGFAQYSRGSVELENTVATELGQQLRVHVHAGGLQVGGGVRLKF